MMKTFAFFAVRANGNQLRFKDPHISGGKAVKSFIFGLFFVYLLVVETYVFASYFTLNS